MLEKIYNKIIEAQYENKAKVVSNNLEKLIEFADAANAEAQFWLAQVYAYPGDLKDDALALKWWSTSAKNGYSRAQYILGLSYAHGDGVVQDVKKAIGFLKKAASQGEPDAMLLLEEIYLDFDEFVDPKLAEKYRKMASELGYERDVEGDSQLADLLGKFDELMGDSTPIHIEMVEHHQVNYHYKFQINANLISQIYSVEFIEAVDILERLRSGEISVDQLVADAKEASVDIDWEPYGEDNWTSRKGGYDVTYKIEAE